MHQWRLSLNEASRRERGFPTSRVAQDFEPGQLALKQLPWSLQQVVARQAVPSDSTKGAYGAGASRAASAAVGSAAVMGAAAIGRTTSSAGSGGGSSYMAATPPNIRAQESGNMNDPSGGQGYDLIIRTCPGCFFLAQYIVQSPSASHTHRFFPVWMARRLVFHRLGSQLATSVCVHFNKFQEYPQQNNRSITTEHFVMVTSGPTVNPIVSTTIARVTTAT